MHATNYQAVALSYCMIADFDDPYAGLVGDANIWRRLNMQQRLGAIVRDLGEVVTLHGDGAYPFTDLSRPSFRGDICADQETFEADMSKFKQAVEWIFGKLEQLWRFVGDKTRKTILLRQMGMEDAVTASLRNFQTSCAAA